MLASCENGQTALVEPLPYALYLFAWDVRDDRPVGLAEPCLLEQHCESYEQAPYSRYLDMRGCVRSKQSASIVVPVPSSKRVMRDPPRRSPSDEHPE